MMLIDATNPYLMEEFEIKKDDLDYEQRKKGFYDVDDFVMVRTTDFLNPEHTLNPICKVPFVTNINNIAHSAMYDILKDKYNIDVWNENKYDNFKKMLEQYSPLSTQFRSTVHFTLNGLVSNHSKGSFDNKNFIIIDKLSKHLGIDDFRSIRMEDTFISGEVPLSNETIILINESKYEQLLEVYPYLNTYNVVLFKGDEKVATEIFLTSMNIVPEKIETHSAEYSRRTELYQKYFASVKEKYGIEEIKHYYSPEYAEDDQKNLILWQIYDNKFYSELFDYFALENDEKEYMIGYLTSYKNDNDSKTEMLKNFIMHVGLEKYQKFVTDYNQNIRDAISQGIYPTNEEILAVGHIEFKNKAKSL